MQTDKILKYRKDENKTGLFLGRVRFQKDVKVSRVPGCPIKPQRVSPHDDVINLMLVEQHEQITEVFLNFHGIVLLRIQWRRFALGASC